MFREGEWQERRGWSDPTGVVIEGLSRRMAALADVPDLDLLHKRYQTRVRASFEAGMELGVLNRMIGLAGRLVRWRLLPSARLFTGLGLWVANRLGRFGTDQGGMLIEAAGQDARGETRVVRWSLKARRAMAPMCRWCRRRR